MATVVNPEDELFWRKLRESYDTLVHGAKNISEVKFQLAHREATLQLTDEFCWIFIRETDPPTITLQAIHGEEE